jgi:hypothetical protein
MICGAAGTPLPYPLRAFPIPRVRPFQLSAFLFSLHPGNVPMMKALLFVTFFAALVCINL